MAILTPLVFVKADKVALIRKEILTPPDPSVLPWSPLPRLDERAIELKERREEAQKQLEARRAQAAKRVYSQPRWGGSSLFSDSSSSFSSTLAPSPASAPVAASAFSTSAPAFPVAAPASPPSPRKPNLSGALRKLEKAGPQTASLGLPGSEVPPGFADLGDSEMPPGFANIERKAQEKKEAQAGIFGHIEGTPRRRQRNIDQEPQDKDSSERPRRSSRNQEISLNFLKTQVFGN